MSAAANSLPSIAQEGAWFVHQVQRTFGPFSREQVVTLIMQKKLYRDAQLLKQGWPDWRPLLACLDELSETESSRKAREAFTAERRVGAPRTPITGDTVTKNKRIEVKIPAKDISTSGIFVVSATPLFRLGEQVEIHLVASELPEPIQARAEVMRYNANARFPVGYGMRFTAIDNRSVVDIARLVGYKPVSEFGIVYSNVLAPVPKDPEGE